MIAIWKPKNGPDRKHREKQGIKACSCRLLRNRNHAVPEAYESPPTKRIRDLENRLAITVLILTAPVNATEMVGALLEDNENHRA